MISLLPVFVMGILSLMALIILSYVLNGMIKRNAELFSDLKSSQGEVIYQKKQRAGAEEDANRLYAEKKKAEPKPSYISINPNEKTPRPAGKGQYPVSRETAIEIDKYLKGITGNLYEGKPLVFELVDGRRVTIDRSKIKEIHVQIGD